MNKKTILAVIIIILNLIAFSQHNVTIHPELTYQYSTNKNPTWDNNSTAFYNYDGEMLMFTIHERKTGDSRHFLHVYRCNKDSAGNLTFEALNFGGNNTIEFGFDEEQLYGIKSIFRSHVFEYNGQVWYHTFAAANLLIPSGNYYDCYVQLPIGLNESESCHSYYKSEYSYSGRPKIDIIKGALQIKNNIWFFAHNEGNLVWTLKKAHLNQSKHFIIDESGTWAVGNFYSELGGVFKFYDQSGNSCFAFNTYDPKNFKLSLAVYKDEPQNQWYWLESPISDCAASTIIKGTINGNRDTVFGQKSWNERFTLFTLSSAQTNGISPITYMEYCFNANDWTLPKLLASGKVNTPTAIPPHKINGDPTGKGYYLQSVYDFAPHVYTNMNTDAGGQQSSPDGLEQMVCLMYPCKDLSFVQLSMASDVWRPDLSANVISTDLDQDGDSMYGKNVRSLWTLAGIIDGAPPSSINWNIWDSVHEPEFHPTSLIFKTEQSSTTELSITSEDKYSVGAEMEFEYKSFSAKEKYKYSHVFKNSSTYERVNSVSLTKSFVLSEETQEYGYLIWAIPQIQRTSYQTYPWWDEEKMQYPIDSSLQYLIRTFGVHIKTEPVKLAEYPFLVDEVNDPGMDSWKLVNRTALNSAFTMHPDVKTAEISFNNQGNPGDETEIFEEITTKTVEESSSSFEIEVEAGIKIPHVFNIGLEAGSEISYSTENTFKSSFSREITASLEHMEGDIGINVENLDLSIFYFQPDKNMGWWYYDSLDQRQYPWYIAYAIISTDAEILLTGPIHEERLSSNELLFSWEDQIENLKDYHLFISATSDFSPSEIVYHKNVGNDKAHNPVGFTPVYNRSYFWKVRGIALTGEPVWSDVQSFQLTDQDHGLSENNIRAVVYPNPIKSASVKCDFDCNFPGNFTISLISMDGKIYFKKDILHDAKGISTLSIPTNSLPNGIYTVAITSTTSITAKKLVVMKK